MSDYRCKKCGNPINPADRTTGHRVVGWEFKSMDPNRRGGSDIKFREPLPEFLHYGCAAGGPGGIDPVQESLL